MCVISSAAWSVKELKIFLFDFATQSLRSDVTFSYIHTQQAHMVSKDVV